MKEHEWKIEGREDEEHTDEAEVQIDVSVCYSC